VSIWDRARGAIEERTGWTLAEAEEVEQLRENEMAFRQFRDEASELAWHVYDWMSGRPHEMRRERRKHLAQQSRQALVLDPLAGAEAEHRANFTFGRGVSPPQAKDENVQTVINRFWNDANNQEMTTGFEAQRTLSNDLLTGANLFPTAYVGGGIVRIGFLESDTITDVVVDPDHRLKVLWYVGTKRTYRWNFQTHTQEPSNDLLDGQPRVVYYQHWRNLEDAIRERQRRGEGALDMPRSGDIGPGLVYHLRINRASIEQIFGNPPWARTLRFYTGMNRLTEARVSMAQAAAAFVAKRVNKGGPTAVAKMAQNLLRQTGELGATPTGMGTQPATRPGSILNENESSRLEALNLRSGGGEAESDSRIVRAAVVAPTGFGPHYFGDPGSANLATASTLELPALMAIGAWQETFEQFYRWQVDLAILEAIRSGELGNGNTEPTSESPAFLSERDFTELRLADPEDREEIGRRIGVDLGYSFQMPYPGRRLLPEVIALVTGVLGTLDPSGQNEPLAKRVLLFLAQNGLEIEDAESWVEDVIEANQQVQKQNAEHELAMAKAAGEMAPPGAEAIAGGKPSVGTGKSKPASGDQTSSYGERRRASSANGSG